jgi:lipid-A-disaccharide synthase-like uncharacterized protein
MAFELIPFPISIIFALVFVIAWVAILWKLRKTGKIYSILFKLSVIAGAILIVAFIYGIIANIL